MAALSQPYIVHDVAFSTSGTAVFLGVTSVERHNFSVPLHIATQHLFACTCIVLQTVCVHILQCIACPWHFTVYGSMLYLGVILRLMQVRCHSSHVTCATLQRIAFLRYSEAIPISLTIPISLLHCP